jgi:hypothetical protein
MAVGPAIAFCLGHMTFPDTHPLWTIFTAPGWIMATLWSIYLVLLVAFFREPDRSHLYESHDTVGSNGDLNGQKGTELPALSSSLDLGNTAKDSSEVEPLMTVVSIGDTNGSTKSKPKTERPLWKNVAVMMSLWLYFAVKMVLEVLMSSLSTITRFYFGWDSRYTGAFMCFLGKYCARLYFMDMRCWNGPNQHCCFVSPHCM